MRQDIKTVGHASKLTVNTAFLFFVFFCKLTATKPKYYGIKYNTK